MPSEVVAVDPHTLRVKAATLAPEFIGGRITSVRYHGRDYVYLVGSQNLYRYIYAHGTLTLDPTWGPVPYLKGGQTAGTAAVVMNDWVIVQTNGAPITPQNPNPTPMSIVAINQNNSSRGVLDSAVRQLPPGGRQLRFLDRHGRPASQHDLHHGLRAGEARRLAARSDRPDPRLDRVPEHGRVPRPDRAGRASRPGGHGLAGAEREPAPPTRMSSGATPRPAGSWPGPPR